MTYLLKQTKHLEILKAKHKSLELQIENIIKGKVIDQFKLQDLKKRKLNIKEQIYQQQLKALIPINDNSITDKLNTQNN